MTALQGATASAAKPSQLDRRRATGLGIVENEIMLIGKTPLVIVASDPRHPVFVKLEGQNPTGSVYDRAATNCELRGPEPHIHRNDALAAALAPMAGLVDLTLKFVAEDSLGAHAVMARAFGAEEVRCSSSCELEVPIDWEAILADILREIETALQGIDLHAVATIPAFGELKPGDLSASWLRRNGVQGRYLTHAAVVARSILPDVNEDTDPVPGVLLDPVSSMTLRDVLAHDNGADVVVALADGAIGLQPSGARLQ